MGRAGAQRGASADDVAAAAGTILCMPTTPFPAPLKGQPLPALEPVRARILELAAHGGLTGVPQVSVPGASVDGLPRVVDRRWPRQRRRAGRGGEGAGGRPMMDVTVNIPEVVAELRALFERYEQALIDKNVEVLDATFWDSPHTIRYAFHQSG